MEDLVSPGWLLPVFCPRGKGVVRFSCERQSLRLLCKA